MSSLTIELGIYSPLQMVSYDFFENLKTWFETFISRIIISMSVEFLWIMITTVPFDKGGGYKVIL